MEQNISLKITADNTQALKAGKEVNNELNKIEKTRVVSTAAKQAAVRAAAGVAGGGGGSGDSSMARGIMGSTRAEGRDFAKQAQGLGGLVHVYATFAANIFAVSAAFGALSRAADTTNMVKGLDQLGIASGRALGTLSKQLVATTDGAISLRDAMTSVAQASSGGMSNANILRMGEAAKKASQALGVAMPDAMSRISRGITKLEPELLDEIGIMVRLDKSSQDYARSLGKSVSALTDFEKRQGFTNAVLDQAEKKFGAIKIDANPYSKILASMENLVHTGLELVNKVLGPIVSVLSSSPTALAAAMGLVAATLLKQAVPAIGKLKDSMAETAKASLNLAVDRAAQASKSYAQDYEKLKTTELAKSKLIREKAVASATTQFEIARNAADNMASQAYQKVEEAETRIAALRSKVRKGTAADKLLNKDPTLINDEDIARLRKNADQQDAKAAKGKKGATEAAALQREYATALEKSMVSQQTFDTKVKEAELAKVDAIRKAGEEQARIHKQYETDADTVVKKQIAARGMWNAANQNQIIADRMLRASAIQSISSAAAQTGATHGFVTALKESHIEIQKARKGTLELEGAAIPAIKNMGTGWAYTKAAIGGATGAISRMLAFLGPWGMAAGVVAAAFSVLDGGLSSAAKEADAFNAAAEATISSIKLLADVSTDLWSQDSSKWMTAESMKARANALSGLTDSFTTQMKELKAFELKANVWDNFWDKYIPFTKSRSQKMSKAIGDGISEALANAPSSEAKGVFETKLKEVLKLKTLSKDNLNKTINESNRGDIIKLEKEYSDAISISAEKAGLAEKAYAALTKTQTELNMSLNTHSLLMKTGIDMVAVATATSASFNDVNTGFSELIRIANTPADLANFGSMGEALVLQKEQIEAVEAAYNAQSKAIEALKKEEAELKNTKNVIANPNRKTAGGSGSAMTSISTQAGLRNEPLFVDSNVPRVSDVSRFIAKGTEELTRLTELKAEYLKSFVKGNLSNLDNGLKRIGAELNKSVALASLKFESTIAGFMVGEAAIEESTRIAMKEIDVRLESNRIAVRDIVEKQKNSLALENLGHQLAKASTEAELRTNRDNLSPIDIRAMESKVVKLNDSINTNVKAIAGLSSKSAFSWYNKAKRPGDKTADDARTDEDAANKVKDTIMTLASQQAAEAAAGLEKKGLKISETMKKMLSESARIAEESKVKVSDLETSIKSVQTLISGSSSMVFVDLVELQEATKQTELTNQLSREKLDIESKYQKLLAANPAGKDALEKSKTEEIRLLGLKETSTSKTIKAEKEAAAERRKGQQYALEELAATERAQDATLSDSSKSQQLDIAKQKLDIYKTLEALSAKELVNEQLLLDKKSLEISSETKLREIKESRSSQAGKIGDKYLTDSAAIENDVSITDPTVRQNALNELTEEYFLKLGRINTLSSANTKLVIDKTTAEKEALEVIAQYAALQAQQADSLAAMQSATENLATLFGDMGTNIGGVAKTMMGMVQAQEKLNLAKEAADKEGDPDKKAKMLAKYEKDSVKTQISGLGQVAGATKKMFGEKTAAYKVMDGIEKASAAMRLALDLKDIAMDMKKFAISIGLMEAEVVATGVALTEKQVLHAAEGAASMAIDIPLIYSKFMAMMGPFGPPAAAAAIAMFMGSAFGGGGGGEVDTTGMTFEDQQALGSGQTYVDGKVVDNGGGVFGDSSAKSESITKSLELIASTSVEGMSYSNRMVELLTDINEGIRKTAVSLYQIPGIAKGTLNGTVEGSSSGGNWLTGTTSSSTEVIDSGVELAGTFMSLVRAGKDAAASINAYSKVKRSSSSSGFLGLIGGGSSSSITPEINKLDSAVREQIGGIFTNAADIFDHQGKKLGRSATDVASILEKIDISKVVSLKGLKGDDLTKALNSAVSEIMDDAAKKLFPELGRFKKFNEGYSETVARVIDTHEKLGLAYASIGSKLKEVKTTDPKVALANAEALAAATTNYQNAQANFNKLQAETPSKLDIIAGHWNDLTVTQVDNVEGVSRVIAAEKELAIARDDLTAATTVSEKDISKFDISEALADAAGGTDKFLEKMSAFKDNFLSAAERLAPQQQALTDRMIELGVPVGTTTEELKSLILGYDVVNAETAEYYVKLLDLSDGYAKVRDSVDEVASAYGLGISNIEDLIKSVKNADAEGTGASMAATILYGLESAMYNQGITAVSTMVLDTVIAPIITAAGNGTIAAYVMSAAFTDSANAAVAAANKIMEAFNNPEVKAMMVNLTAQLAPLFTQIGSYAPIAPINPNANKSGSSSASTKVEDLEGDEFKKLSKELEDLKDQGLTPAALLIKQSTALLSDRNRQKFEEIQLEKKLIQTKKDQKDFDLKYIDTMVSIHQGTAKTNAEYTKLATTFLTLDGADKLGMDISGVSEAFKSMDTTSIYEFITNLDRIDVLSPDVKVGLMGIAQSLLTMKNAADQAKNSLEAKIYTAQGNSEAALAITRAAELATLDDSLKPRQLYLYALEDEANLKAKLKTAYDKEIGSMKDLIGKLKETSKTIKEYQNSLKLGDLSTLTPEQKYEEAKSQAMALANIISSTDKSVTVDDKIAAANKLPAAAEAVLTASKTLFASSSQYQDDYNTVQSYLSSVTDIIDSVVPEGEKQLLALETSNAKLTAIETNSAAIVAALEGMPAKIEAARLAAEDSGSIAASTGLTGAAGAYFKSSPEMYANYKKDNLGVSPDQYAAIAYAVTNIGTKPNVALDLTTALSIAEKKFGITGVDRAAVEANLSARGIEFYAKGGLASGISMVGEQGPELVDFKTPARVYSNTASNQLLSNKELIEEIRKLREEVKQLRSEQKEQTGHLITSNYDANKIASDKVAAATQDAANAAIWAKRSGVKLN